MATFSPRTITKELLGVLPERSRAVIVGRFGLGKSGEKMTLETIGQEYDITRERVRQIESHGLSAIRKSDAYDKHKAAFAELAKAVKNVGSIVSEEMLLGELAKNKTDQNHVYFMLVVGEPFTLEKEDNSFVRRWHVDGELSDRVHAALETLHEAVDPENLIPEEEFMSIFTKHLEEAGIKHKDPNFVNRWLGLTKKISRNPLGEWGHTDSSHVRVKSMRDYAYLTLRRHGSPMHFTEVAQQIGKLFGKKAHPATCHNELIKDKRFVLVGRGLYALSDWGYAPGVVRDVVKGILSKEGPLTRDEIIERVKRERYVKNATIIVNLQDPVFKRTSDGKYTLAK